MITDNYIEMCEQAEEIQKWWFPNIGDSYYIKSEKETKLITLISEKIWLSERSRGCNFIYLPTLEQLFEMVGNYKAQISRIFLSIMIIKKYKFESIQELVLNAVMEIKYNKAWTGEKLDTHL